MNIQTCAWTSTLALMTVLALCGGPAVAAEPLAFVPITSAARVQVMDVRNGTTVAQIPTAPAPVGIVLDTPRNTAYVAHQNVPNGQLTRIDTRSRQVTGLLVLPSDAWGLALSADGATAYVALAGSNQLGIVDTASLSLTQTLPTGSTPRNVLLSADGARIYVANQFGATLTVVDGKTHTLIGTYPVCDTPLGMAMTADGAALYVVCFFEQRVVRVDPMSLTLIGSAPTGAGPSAVAVSADGSRVYVANTRDDSVTVLDGNSLAVVARIPVGAEPYGLAVSSDGTRAYTSTVQGKNLAVIDSTSLSVVSTYPLIDSAFAVGHFLAPASVPDAPSILSATGSNGAATMQFAAPSFDGGSAITGYLASCGDQTQSGSLPSIQVTQLQPGASYACSVQAQNSVGDSLPSASVQIIAAGVPGVPRALAATPGSGHATLLFEAPKQDGGSPITQYHAQCAPGALSASAAGAPITVPGLTDNRLYACRVWAANLIGDGAWSAPVRVIPGNFGSSTDLHISKTNASDFVGGGQRIGYLITVRNPGPAPVVGARVTDQLESYFSDVQWLCSGMDGGTCALATAGTGDLDTLIDLPIGAQVQFQLSAQLAPVPEDPVFNLAAVEVPVGYSDLDPGNNVASDGPDIRGVFRDGFE